MGCEASGRAEGRVPEISGYTPGGFSLPGSYQLKCSQRYSVCTTLVLVIQRHNSTPHLPGMDNRRI